jgi:hypothetical protein
MLSYIEPLLFAAAFWVAWDYRRPEPLLPALRRALAPVTLEDQRTIDWLASVRLPSLPANTGTRARPRTGYLARRRAGSKYTPRHYARENTE